MDELLELYADQHELIGRDAEREASDRDVEAAAQLEKDCENLHRILIFHYPPAEIAA